MPLQGTILTESYSTFWDDAPVELTDGIISKVELEDPYADFQAATEEESESTDCSTV